MNEENYLDDSKKFLIYLAINSLKESVKVSPRKKKKVFKKALDYFTEKLKQNKDERFY